jgi:hypothetical protein
MGKMYLAYGSNMNVEQMRWRCPGATPVATGVLHGYDLVFRVHATIEPHPGGEVPFVLWDISAANERVLDRYEGFPRYYFKKTLPVYAEFFDGSAEFLDAMAYVMVRGRSLCAPDPGYVNIILQGYERFGFNPETLYNARGFNKEVYLVDESEKTAHSGSEARTESL